MFQSRSLIAAILFLSLCGSTFAIQDAVQTTQEPKTAIFAGGCFWCSESDFEHAPGVVQVRSGYSGGKSPNPTYKTYVAKGHKEVVLIAYDPKRVTYAGLVEYFLKHIDPTDRGGSFIDRGKGYAPAIFVANEEERSEAQRVIKAIDAMKVFNKPINVPILDRMPFFPAEEYHQDYHTKNAAQYGAYRMRCGRDAFVRKIWGAKADQLQIPGAFPETAVQESKRPFHPIPSENAQLPEAKESPWSDFKKPDSSILKKKLSRMEYRVTQESETELPFQNSFWNHHETGLYVDVVSGEPLFASFDKFDSGTGWPSFVRPIDSRHVTFLEDRTEGMQRIEVRSRFGNSHLGHVFTDGPKTRGGLRFCINSASLKFIPVEKLRDEGYDDYIPMFADAANGSNNSEKKGRSTK